MTTSVVTVSLPDKDGVALPIQMLRDDATGKLYNVFFDPTDLVPIDPTAAVPVVGNDAHGAAPASNPFAGAIIARTSPPTAVTNGQQSRAIGSIYGEQLAIGALREMKVPQKSIITNSSSPVDILTADATYKKDLYGLILANRSSTECYVTIKDNATTVGIYWLAAKSNFGFMLSVDSAIPQAAVNTAWTATCSSGSVDSIEITALAVKHL